MGDVPDEAATARRQEGPARRAYVTLVTTESFVVGARVMLWSLRSALTASASASVNGRARPAVVVLVTAAVPAKARAALAALCDEVREVEDIPNPFAAESHVQGWIDSGFTKLWIWALEEEFDRVVYIDADCLVLEDVSELFDLDTDLAAAPDVFPPDRFNAGVLVVKPNRARFEELRRQAEAKEHGSYDGGDTGFLNACFPGWFQGPAAGRLPFAFNAQRTLHWLTHDKNPGYWAAVQPVKILHFSSSPKPWEEAKRKGELEMLWWQHFLSLQLQGL